MMLSIMPLELLNNLLGIILSLAICYYFGSVIYNLYFNPLAKYPGPFLAKISTLPSFYYSITGYRHIWIWQCHQIYGNRVRFRPNGVVVNSPIAYRSIYSNKANVKKAVWYVITARKSSNFSTLNTVDKTIHARKRRLLSGVLSEKAIRSLESFVVKHIDRWCELLTYNTVENEWTEPRNMAISLSQLVFDIIGDLVFGRSFEIKEPEENQLKAIPHKIDSFFKFLYPIYHSPFSGIWVWLKPRGINYLFDLKKPKAIEQFHNFVDESVRNRRLLEENQQKHRVKDEDIRKDIFYYLFHADDQETGMPAYTENELNAEANFLFIAGSDTTATAMCSIFFYLSRYPQVYRKLTQEIRSTFNSVGEIHGGTVSSCRYLRACIDEAMRMTPVAPSELPREVLPGGLMLGDDFFPPGTLIGSAGWSLMHSEDAFGDPWVYRPERWIVDEKNGVSIDDVSRAQASFIPFSTGPSNCLGQKLAMLEMMLTVGRTLYLMDLKAPSGDSLGAGAPSLGWGRRNKNVFQVRDAYLSLRDGPMIQFKRREA